MAFNKIAAVELAIGAVKMHLVYIFNSWKLAKKNFTKV
jgi:hypothetical protein